MYFVADFQPTYVSRYVDIGPGKMWLSGNTATAKMAQMISKPVYTGGIGERDQGALL